MGVSLSGDFSLRGELVKTLIVCDLFLVSNFNEYFFEKVMEKYFVCEDLNMIVLKIGEIRRSDLDIIFLNIVLGVDIGFGLIVIYLGN